MKKFLLLLSLVGIINFSFGQSVKFGIKAGLNFSGLSDSFSFGGSSITLNSSTYTGFQVGAIADIAIAKFSVQPGIFYSTRGGGFGGAATGAPNYTLNYIEVPINLLYNVAAGPGKIFLGGGPYLGFGISGSNMQNGKTTDVTFGDGTNNNENFVKNPDFGIGFLAGYRLSSGILFSAGYGLGLINLSNDTDYMMKSHILSFSVGYFFK